MGKHWLFAVPTILDRDRLQVQVAAAFALSRVRSSSLRYGHVWVALSKRRLE
jgi:hypothetical protein